MLQMVSKQMWAYLSSLILMYRYWRLYKNVSLLYIHLNLALALLVSLILFVATVDLKTLVLGIIPGEFHWILRTVDGDYMCT